MRRDRGRDQPDGVGHVRDERWDVERQQQRERHERSGPDDGVDGAGEHARAQDGDQLKERHLPTA